MKVRNGRPGAAAPRGPSRCVLHETGEDATERRGTPPGGRIALRPSRPSFLVRFGRKTRARGERHAPSDAHEGGRFSRAAAMPSRGSSVWKEASKASMEGGIAASR